jgi:hypothetical protein
VIAKPVQRLRSLLAGEADARRQAVARIPLPPNGVSLSYHESSRISPNRLAQLSRFGLLRGYAKPCEGAVDIGENRQKSSPSGLAEPSANALAGSGATSFQRPRRVQP